MTVTGEAERLRILLIEDDERLTQLTAKYLESHGHAVTTAGDGRQGLVEALRGRYDVIILDRMLPSLSGLEVCREIRSHTDVPIIMVTALTEESDRVSGLEGGADDYVPKPFSSRELLARIRALVRRARGGVRQVSDMLTVGRLVLQPQHYSATLDGRPLKLTTAEFNLLRVLAERAGRVLSREQLLDLTKGSSELAFDRSIDAHISHLRHKLGDDPRAPQMLKTVRGAGYLLVADAGMPGATER
jgi:DNA-binding response OmpR family regulator